MTTGTLDYQITEKLFQSPKTQVFRAIREKDQHPVILKMLSEDYPSSETIAQFNYEYQITQKASEIPGVIQLYTKEQLDQHFTMVLEDISGISLSQANFNSSFSLSLFFKVAIPLVNSLKEIHQHQIIHKDLNPSNIIWNPKTGDVRIIDFGNSSDFFQSYQSISNINQIEGNLAYISPEQTGRMNRAIDIRTDFYSLGVTFYELLAGQLPFEAQDTAGWVYCHITHPPTPIHEINPEVPKPLSNILLKLMAKNVEDRYQSAFGLLKDLEFCQVEWETNQKIPPFSLGKWDTWEQFQISKKLHGRQSETQKLMKTFSEASEGGTKLMLISGDSGVGKTSLINEIQKPIVQNYGYFIFGKFDQLGQDRPYSALGQAIQGLVRQLLTESETKLQYWKEEVLKALGPNGQLILELIPELEQLIGEQPPLQTVDSTEAQNRFLITFQKFFGVFAQKGHPLVLFLDDLQWADGSTLHLIQNVMQDNLLPYFMIIGAYRDSEVTNEHPLNRIISALAKINSLQMIHLSPLRETGIAHMLADTLECDLDRVQSIAQVIFQKTQGNPFFVNELLKDFYQKGFIYFQGPKGEWEWNLSKIQATDISDNVIEFLINQIKTLSSTTIQLLKTASCIGNLFDLKVLSWVHHDYSMEQCAIHLWEALKQGYVVPVNLDYKLYRAFGDSARKSNKGNHFSELSYKFRHDRIQQAFYALIPKEEKEKRHFSIGKLMFEHATLEEKAKQLIEIAGQLNAGIHYLETSVERLELAQLNLQAGQKAKQSGAHQQAFHYMEISLGLLKEEDWQSHYKLIFQVYTEFVECAFTCTKFDVAETCIETLLKYAETPWDQVRVYRVQIEHFLMIGNPDEALDLSLHALSLLDINISPNISRLSIESAWLKLRFQLRKYKIADLVNLPVATDPSKIMATELLFIASLATVSQNNQELFTFLILTGMQRSLRYGNTPSSANFYVNYASILQNEKQDYTNAYAFGKLAEAVGEAFGNHKIQGRVTYACAFIVYYLHDPWETLRGHLQKAIDAGLQAGDLFYVSFSCSVITQWDLTHRLEEIIQDSRYYLSLVEKTKFQEEIACTNFFYHFYLNLNKQTEDRFSFNSRTFKEEELLSGANFVEIYLALFHLKKIQIAVLYDNLEMAKEHLQHMDSLLVHLTRTPFEIEFCFYAFLTYAAQLTHNSETLESLAIRKKLKVEYKKMQHWITNTPAPFLHFFLLMQAEKARLEGNMNLATSFYEQAITETKRHGYLFQLAFAYEWAAKFHLTHNHQIGKFYIRESYNYFTVWGATAKAEQLEETYPQLLEKKRLPISLAQEGDQGPEASLKSHTTTESTHSIDLTTIMKTSQVLSGEIKLDRLLKKFMTIVMENAGADKGLLVLPDHKSEKLLIQASQFFDENVEILGSIDIESSDWLSTKIVRYVSRSKSHVVLGDAPEEGEYTEDPYIKKNHPKSILCLPAIKQGELIGILYLENQVLRNAFTQDRLDLLQILTTQAAISIENASLVENLEDQVQIRTQKLTKEIETRKSAEKSLQASLETVQKQQEQMEHELVQARKTQKCLLPSKLPKIPQAQIAFRFHPMQQIGGDFYNIFKLHDGLYGILLADVVGHGIPAALLSFMVSVVFTNSARSSHSPQEVLKQTNAQLKNNLPPGQYATMFYGTYDSNSQILRYSNGGHPPALVVRQGETQIIDLKMKGNMVGCFPPELARFGENTFQLQAGDKFLLYTDGVTEVRNDEGEMLGTNGLKAMILPNIHLSIDQLLQHIYEEIDGYNSQPEPHDDIALVGLEIE